jgi:hypothetical protein
MNTGIPSLRIVAVHGVGNSFSADITDTRLEELRTLKAAAWARQLCNGLGVPRTGLTSISPTSQTSSSLAK